MSVKNVFFSSAVPNAIALASIVASSITSGLIGRTDPTQFNVYPNKLLVLVHDLLIGQSGIALAIIFYFRWKPRLWRFHGQRSEEVVHAARQWFRG
jgi:hypothetical protein